MIESIFRHWCFIKLILPRLDTALLMAVAKAALTMGSMRRNASARFLLYKEPSLPKTRFNSSSSIRGVSTCMKTLILPTKIELLYTYCLAQYL